MRSDRLIHLAMPLTLALLATACPPDSGPGPSPTSTSSTTAPPTQLSLVSGYEPPSGTGAALPGGGSIIFFHKSAEGAGPGLPGRWPIWQYTGSGPATISADPAGGGLPGFPSNHLLPNVAPGWSRVTYNDYITGADTVISASPFGLPSPTLLGTLPYPPSLKWAEAWSPDGRYLAMTTDPLQPSTELYIVDTQTFTTVRHVTLAGPAAIRHGEHSRPAWTPDSTKVAVGTTAGIQIVGVSGPNGDSSAPWPVQKPCSVSDVSVGGRVAVLCENMVGLDSLFNLFTQALDGTDAHLVISPTIMRPMISGSGAVSPHAVFSPDGHFLAIHLNTLSGMGSSVGVLAVVADEPLAPPLVLTNLTPSSPLGGVPGGDAPMAWVATALQQ